MASLFAVLRCLREKSAVTVEQKAVIIPAKHTANVEGFEATGWQGRLEAACIVHTILICRASKGSHPSFWQLLASYISMKRVMNISRRTLWLFSRIPGLLKCSCPFDVTSYVWQLVLFEQLWYMVGIVLKWPRHGVGVEKKLCRSFPWCLPCFGRRGTVMWERPTQIGSETWMGHLGIFSAVKEIPPLHGWHNSEGIPRSLLDQKS